MSAEYIGLDIVSKTRLQYIAATQLAAIKLMTEPELKQTLKEANKMLKKAADYDARVAWWDSYMKAVNIYMPINESDKVCKVALINQCWSAFKTIKSRGLEFDRVVSNYVKGYLGLGVLGPEGQFRHKVFNGFGVNDFRPIDDLDIQWLQNLLSKIENVKAIVSKDGLEIDRLNALCYKEGLSKIYSDDRMRIFDSYIRGDLDFSMYKWSDYNPSDLVVE